MMSQKQNIIKSYKLDNEKGLYINVDDENDSLEINCVTEQQLGLPINDPDRENFLNKLEKVKRGNDPIANRIKKI